MGWERRGGKKKAKKECEEAKNKNKMRVQKIKMEKVKFHLDLQ